MYKFVLWISVLTPPSMASTPSMVTCYSLSPESFNCSWVTDVAAGSVVEWGLVSGMLTNTVDRGIGDSRTHSVLIDGIRAEGQTGALTAYAQVCDEAGVDCSSEQTISIAAQNASHEPIAPTLADTAWTAGTGTEIVVDAVGCNASLAAALAAVTTNGKITLPVVNDCTLMGVTNAAAENVLITTASTNRPPTGVRDDCVTWTCSTWYRAFLNMLPQSDGQMAALTGNVALGTYLPGTLAYEFLSASWNLKKAALAGSPVTITNATNADPIVITAPGHGFSDGDTVCIDSVLGNLPANGCFIAASTVAGTSFALKLRDGTTNQAGVTGYNYTSGGQVQGLVWTVITPNTTNAGPLSGACATAGNWGHDTTAMYFTYGMYRCGTDLKWYQISNPDNAGTDADGHQYTSAINAAVNTQEWRIEGITFPVVPIDPEPECAYGPVVGAYSGCTVGGVFEGWRGVDKIDFNQWAAPQDFDTWRIGGNFFSLFTGFTTNMSIRNGTGACGRFALVFIAELEQECQGVFMGQSNGPITITNNYWDIKGGWAVYSEESTGFTRHQNISFTGNYVKGGLDYAYGTPYYDQPTRSTGPIYFKVRQLFELKTGAQVDISGNTFDGLYFSASPVASAISFGTQTGFTFTSLTIDADGVLSVNAQNPLPLSLAANQRMMLFNNSSGDPAILRIDNITANVITFKNLDGTAYDFGAQTSGSLCSLEMAYNISDVTITSNTIINAPDTFNAFGNSYSYGSICQPAPVQRVKITNNLSKLQAYGVLGGPFCGTTGFGCTVTGAWPAGYVDFLQMSNNTMLTTDVASTDSNLGFLSADSAVNYKGTGLLVQRNLFGSEDNCVTGNAGLNGTALLDERYPGGYVFTGNAMVRSGGSCASNPSGQAYPTVAQVDYTAEGFPTYGSAYLAYGAAQRPLQRAQGLLSNPRVHTDANSVIVQFTSPVAGQHWYAEISDDDGATWTRATSTGSGYEQAADVTANAATVYDVRMVGPQGITALGKVRTP